jgi:hypothetical protein
MNTKWILNLTQHPASVDQREQGVIDLEGKLRDDLTRNLTFDEIPYYAEVVARAAKLATIAAAAVCAADPEGPHVNDVMDGIAWIKARVMIGGAPFLMAPLE